MSLTPKPMTPESAASGTARLHTKVAEFLGAIDTVLADGRRIQARFDAFCREHALHAGMGEEGLLAHFLPPQTRLVHQRLLELQQQVYDAHLGTSVRLRTVANTAPRALAHRTRI